MPGDPQTVTCPNCGCDYTTALDLRRWKDGEIDADDPIGTSPSAPSRMEAAAALDLPALIAFLDGLAANDGWDALSASKFAASAAALRQLQSQGAAIRAALTNDVIRAIGALARQREVCREQGGETVFVSGMDAAREYAVETLMDALAGGQETP